MPALLNSFDTTKEEEEQRKAKEAEDIFALDSEEIQHLMAINMPQACHCLCSFLTFVFVFVIVFVSNIYRQIKSPIISVAGV